MKKIICLFFVLSFVVFLFAQKTNTENTILINGILYYYKPSETKSSAIPNFDGAHTIDTGNWYGENAARFWAAAINWVVEHCTDANNPVKSKSNEIVYITSVHVYKGNTPESRKYAVGATMNNGFPSRDGLTIYYWVVPKGETFENGRKEYRSFAFSNW